jgi:hypothetical protein
MRDLALVREADACGDLNEEKVATALQRLFGPLDAADLIGTILSRSEDMIESPFPGGS